MSKKKPTPKPTAKPTPPTSRIVKHSSDKASTNHGTKTPKPSSEKK